MKKKQISEADFDFFNVSNELKKVEEKQVESKQTTNKVEVRNTNLDSEKDTKKTKKVAAKLPNVKTKKRVTKVDELFVVEEEERDPFKTVQVRTSLWKEAEAISKKIEAQTGKKYSATKVLNRILEDYFNKS